MRIGIAGAHRTGKTSLAEKLCERLPFMTFGKTSVSNARVWTNYGINPDGYFTFVERLQIQEELFNHMRGIVENTTAPAIFDRTYLDLLGYLYANIDETCSSMYDNQVMDYTIRNMQAMSRDFNKLIIVPPALEPISADNKSGKVFMSRAYIEAINNHIVSYAARSGMDYIIIPFEMTDLAERVNFCAQYIEGQPLPVRARAGAELTA